jgi:hypothetical protein
LELSNIFVIHCIKATVYPRYWGSYLIWIISKLWIILQISFLIGSYKSPSYQTQMSTSRRTNWSLVLSSNFSRFIQKNHLYGLTLNYESFYKFHFSLAHIKALPTKLKWAPQEEQIWVWFLVWFFLLISIDSSKKDHTYGLTLNYEFIILQISQK